MIKNKIKQQFPILLCVVKKIRLLYWSMLPLKYIIKKKWKQEFGSKLNIENPRTYNEKIQWLKLHPKKDAIENKCTDKLYCRKLIEDKIGKKYLNNLIKVYDNLNQVDFKNLPSSYVLKSTHDSGSVLIVKNNQMDFKQLKNIKCNFNINHAKYSHEWVYDSIKPKIIIEEFLESDDGKDLKDYKVFCFHGKAKLIQVDIDRYGYHKRDFYDINWKKLTLQIKFPSSKQTESKPKMLDKMIELSELLAQDFIHVRVDWYMVNEKLIFGEMTFFHGSGYEKFNDIEWEYRMGDWIEIQCNNEK